MSAHIGVEDRVALPRYQEDVAIDVGLEPSRCSRTSGPACKRIKRHHATVVHSSPPRVGSRIAEELQVDLNPVLGHVGVYICHPKVQPVSPPVLVLPRADADTNRVEARRVDAQVIADAARFALVGQRSPYDDLRRRFHTQPRRCRPAWPERSAVSVKLVGEDEREVAPARVDHRYLFQHTNRCAASQGNAKLFFVEFGQTRPLSASCPTFRCTESAHILAVGRSVRGLIRVGTAFVEPGEGKRKVYLPGSGSHNTRHTYPPFT